MKCPICESEFCDHNAGQKNQARERINSGLPAVDQDHEDWVNNPHSNPYRGLRLTEEQARRFDYLKKPDFGRLQ